MTLDEAVADLERDRTVIDGAQACDPLSWSRAVTGEAFFCITSRGLKDECQPYVVGAHHSENDAIAAWHREAMTYATSLWGPRPGVLYWRVRPEIIHVGNRVTVYSRFLISDRAPLVKVAA